MRMPRYLVVDRRTNETTAFTSERNLIDFLFATAGYFAFRRYAIYKHLPIEGGSDRDVVKRLRAVQIAPTPPEDSQ